MTVLPEAREASQFTVGPDSLVWRRSSDPRLIFAAGRALLLQVAHPTVSHGVVDHSVFASDPWGRLLRTADYANLTVYGGDLAAHVMAHTRELHKQIKGNAPDGGRYHALEPGAWAWVHLSLGESVIATGQHFGRRMNDRDQAAFYADWRRLGRLLGLRERDMPATWDLFQTEMRRIVSDTLQVTPTFLQVLDMLSAPPPPAALPAALNPLWKTGMVVPGHALRLATTGLLPEQLRRRSGLPWTIAEQAQFELLGRASRALNPVMVGPAAVTGPVYLRLRRGAIAAQYQRR